MSSSLRDGLSRLPLDAVSVEAWLAAQGRIEELQLEEQGVSQTADEVTIPIPPQSLTGGGPEFIKTDQAPTAAPPPPVAPLPSPPPAAAAAAAPQPRGRNSDLGARQLQHALGAQVNYALYLQRILPEDIAARIGLDADRFEQFLAGRDGSITLDELLSVTRETGARLSIGFVPPARVQ